MKLLLILLSCIIANSGISQSFSTDWRGNKTELYDKPDTTKANIYIVDSNGYVKYISVYKVVLGMEFISAQGDAYYSPPLKKEIGTNYIYLNKKPVKEKIVFLFYAN